MKYERLTVRLDDGRAYIKDDSPTGLLNILYRLAEIEDMVERGELVKVPKGAVVLTPEERAEEMRLCSEERKEAVKEFAKKLRDKEFPAKIGSEWCAVVKSRDIIDELVKEVRGE